jgi:hypothetical protein
MDEHDTAPRTVDHPAPVYTRVIVDLGKASKKQIKRFKRGEQGRLQDEVEQAIQRARERLPEADKDKELVPVVLIYRQKRRRASVGGLPLPIPPLFR